MVDRLVRAVGEGVVKRLIHDRGLVDGKTVGRLKSEAKVDRLFPLKKGMDLWVDAKVLAHHRGQPWQRYDLPQSTSASPPSGRPEVLTRREATRQETLQKKVLASEPTEPARVLEWIEYQWIEPSRVWESGPVAVSVLLLVNHYANGDTLEWALASTREFSDPLERWTRYGVRPGVEEDHRQEKCFWELTHFRSTAFSLVVNRIVFIELAYSLIQIFLKKRDQQELLGKTRQRLLDALLPSQNKIARYYKQRYGLFHSDEYQEHLLTLTEAARRKVLATTHRLRRGQWAPPRLPWRPE